MPLAEPSAADVIRRSRVVPAGAVDTSRPHNVITRMVAAGSAPLRIGAPAVQSELGDRLVKAPDGSAAPFVGIAIGDRPHGPLVVDAYAPGSMAALLTGGAVFVEVAAAVVAQAPVFYDPAAGALSTVPGPGRQPLPRAEFQNAALAGDLALLSF